MSASSPTSRTINMGPESTLLQRRKERLQSSTSDFVPVHDQSNQQAVLCWSCFLPIFGNNPDMFDGDHIACSQIVEEEPICSNWRYQDDPFQYREIKSPLLVTIPSPVSVFVEADPQPQGHIDAMSSQANVSIPPILILP
jgi:hypothetical protein